MIPAFTFYILIVFEDEMRKVLLRKGMDTKSTPEGTIVKYNGWIARNTYY